MDEKKKQKLKQASENLMRYVWRIETQNVASPEELRDNDDKQDIVFKNLEKAVEMCVRIGKDVLKFCSNEQCVENLSRKGTFWKMLNKKLMPPDLASRLVADIDLRDVTTHDFINLNFWDVFEKIPRFLSDCRRFVLVVSAL